MDGKNYEVIQGDSFVINFTYTNGIPTQQYPNGTPIDISNSTIIAEFRDKPGGSQLAATCEIGDGITIVDAVNGRFTLNVTPEKTRKFVYPKTAFQVQYISNGGIASTLLKGWINVDAGVIP